MRFNAFARFGMTGFTRAEPVAQKIYEAMKKSLGRDFNQDFNGSRVQAKLFAQAMGIARAALTLRRVKNNAIAMKATDLLPNLEAFYGVIPVPDATDHQRRLRLHARMQVVRGAREESVNSVLTALLGDDFLEWVVATADTLVRFPDTAAEAALVGHYVPPGTPARVLRVTEPVFGGEQTVAVEELTPPLSAIRINRIPRKTQTAPTRAGTRQPAIEYENVIVPTSNAAVGLSFLIDPSVKARRERGVFTGATYAESGALTSVTADFAGPHDSGCLITTQYFPTWRTNAQAHLFVLSDDAAVDIEKRRQASGELRRSLRGVARWSLCDQSGPFQVGVGQLGVTTIGELE